MPIISIANSKGGVGKSTSGLNLAHSIKGFAPTALVESDPQGTIIKLQHIYKDLPVHLYDKNVPLASLPYSFLVVDTPPYITEHYLDIFAQSDLVIIPTQAGIAELLEIKPMIEVLKEAQKRNPKLKWRAFINFVVAASGLTEEIRQQILEMEMECFNTSLMRRENYKRSLGYPNGIFDLKDNKAEAEVNALVKESLILLNS